MPITVSVENIKLGDCTSSIHKALLAIPGIAEVDIDVVKSDLHFEGDEALPAIIAKRLLELGYPTS